MTTDLRNALEEIAAMTYDAWTNGARAGEIARAALAAAPSTSPAAAAVAGEPVATVQKAGWEGSFVDLCIFGVPVRTWPEAEKDSAKFIARKVNFAAPHPSPSAAEQAGRWVPVKPTKAMHEAAVKTIVRCTGNDDWPPRVWRAMLAAAPSASPAEAPADQSPDDLRARFDAWLKTTPDWAPEYEQHRAWVELFAWWAVHALAAHPQPVAPAGQAAAGVQGEAACWHEGPPPFPQNQEWFIAETIYGDRVVLRALEDGHSYDYTTADRTYMKVQNVKRWMQFPDCEYLPPSKPAPAVERGVTIERSVAQEIRETLSTYVTTYNDCWERGMDILEPMGDKALALLDAALSTAGKEQA